VTTPVYTPAKRGDRLATLKALRDRIAHLIDQPTTSPKDVAALSRQLQDVLAAIEKEEPDTHEGSPLDEVNRRRAARATRPHPPRTGARRH